MEADQEPSLLFSLVNTLLLSVVDCCRVACKIIAFWIHLSMERARGHACYSFNNNIRVALASQLQPSDPHRDRVSSLISRLDNF